MTADGRTERFFPHCRVQTTYPSLYTRERDTHTGAEARGVERGRWREKETHAGTRGARVNGPAACRVSPKAPLKIVASSKPSTSVSRQDKRRALALASFCLFNRATHTARVPISTRKLGFFRPAKALDSLISSFDRGIRDIERATLARTLNSIFFEKNVQLLDMDDVHIDLCFFFRNPCMLYFRKMYCT